jgi:hypothetical protein|tara:strand:- start:476 stop:1051 length:576 start_codon:yes stop_codon:yes gene_type:complete
MEPVTAALIASAVGLGTKGIGAGIKHLKTKGAYAPIKKEAARAEQRLATGKGYGMSAAQKREAMKQAAFASNAALGEERARLQAQQATTGGVASGVAAQQAAGLGQQSATAQALASAEMEKASQQVAHQEKAADLAKVQAHAEKVAADWDWIVPAAESASTAGLQAAALQSDINYNEYLKSAGAGTPGGNE